jgi:hypothetical protein
MKCRALFFMLRWDQYIFHKNRVGTRYGELEFLHPVGSTNHIVHFGAFGVRNVDALFFMVGWDQYEFNKKRIGKCYVEHVFLHPMVSVGHIVHSGASDA